MNFFDIIFTLIIVVFFLFSFSRGSLRALLSAVGVGLGYLLADRFHERYVSITLQYLSDYGQAKIVTYLALFVIGIIIGVLLSAVVRIFFTSFQNPALPSRILGGLLGILIGSLFCLLILFVVEQYLPSFADDLVASFYTPWLKTIEEIISGINFAFISNKPPV